MAEDDYRGSARSLEIQGNSLSAATVGRMLCREGEMLEQELFGTSVLLAQHTQAAANPPQLLIVSGDGSRYRTNEADRRKGQPERKRDPKDRGWRENKIGVVVRAAPGKYDADGKYHPSTELLKTYIASTASIGAFGNMLQLEAQRRGVQKARQFVFLSDN